jgi:hypothetical protein
LITSTDKVIERAPAEEATSSSSSSGGALVWLLSITLVLWRRKRIY